jgi:hypothetical protein
VLHRGRGVSLQIVSRRRRSGQLPSRYKGNTFEDYCFAMSVKYPKRLKIQISIPLLHVIPVLVLDRQGSQVNMSRRVIWVPQVQTWLRDGQSQRAEMPWCWPLRTWSPPDQVSQCPGKQMIEMCHFHGLSPK